MQEKWRQDPSEESVDFSTIEKRIFSNYGGKSYIGGVEVTEQIRSLLREQARYINSSQLLELLNATITNEAGNLALVQSSTFEQVQFAKALHHWNFVLRSMLTKLAE